MLFSKEVENLPNKKLKRKQPCAVSLFRHEVFSVSPAIIFSKRLPTSLQNSKPSTRLNHACFCAVWTLDRECGQEVLRHLDQGVTWPPQEPVHRAAGYQGCGANERKPSGKPVQLTNTSLKTMS